MLTNVSASQELSILIEINYRNHRGETHILLACWNVHKFLLIIAQISHPFPQVSVFLFFFSFLGVDFSEFLQTKDGLWLSKLWKSVNPDEDSSQIFEGRRR